MATTTEKPTAAELREQKAARVADEQTQMAEARERAEQEAAAVAAFEAGASSSNGRRGGVQVDGQDGLFDTIIENTELEQALEAREKVKASRAALNAKFKEADDTAKGLISTLDIEVDQVVRVGRFRISRTAIEGRSVAFETEPTDRLNIAPVD